jgi:hypothetical protein
MVPVADSNLLLAFRSSFRRLFIACALQASVQMTGVSAIQYFSVSIFAQIGISSDNALKYQAINSILALLAQAACIATIDKFGRRWPLILGNLLNCVTFIIATALIGSSYFLAAAVESLSNLKYSLLPSWGRERCQRGLGLYHCVCEA